MVLGRATYEQDAYKIRPLLMERGRLTRASAASATTIYINSLPRNVAGYGGFAVIDPWTTECEVRLITNRAGKILTLASALTYAHAKFDEVIFIDRPWINALWFTAVGDDSTANATALARWGAQCAAVGKAVAYLPKGTYRYATGLDWSGATYDGVSLVGDGPGSILKATAAMTMLTVDAGSAVNGFRYGAIKDILFEGNSLANIGIYLGKAILYRTDGVTVQTCTGTPGVGIVMDDTQNSGHSNLISRANDIDLLMVNGAANNSFVNCHFTAPNTYAIHMDIDSAYSGYDGVNGANQNAFYRCIVEPGTVTGMSIIMYIEYGHRNLFNSTSFTRPATGNTTLVKITTTAGYNAFTDRCRFNTGGNAYEPLVYSEGDATLFADCLFSSPPSAMDAIQVNDGYILVDKCHFDTDFVPVEVLSGTIPGRVWYFANERSVGTTANRPESNDVIGAMYYDTDLAKPIWKTATQWTDATGATV